MQFVQIKNYINMKKRAFTLFELLVSISIIGILIAVASLSYGSAQKKTRDIRRMEDLNSIQKAAEMYYSQYSAYPLAANFFNDLRPFLPATPSNPKGNPYQPSNNPANTTNYCVGVGLDNPIGNCSASNCTGYPTTNGGFYCVKNQQ